MKKLVVLFSLVVVALVFWPRLKKTASLPATPAATVNAVPVLPAPAASPTPSAEKPVLPVRAVDMNTHDLQTLRAQMQDYAQLGKKVLKTDGDREAWNSLIKDPHTIYYARKVLLLPNKNEPALQDRALEFLLEAAKTGDPNAAAALDAVISDDAIEGNSVARPVQQFKAELKATALYQWTSSNPEQEAHVATLLPGPVSQKIWRNVLAQQANNVSESEAERSP